MKKDGFSIRFFSFEIWKIKKAKIKKQHFRQPANRKPNFSIS